MRSATRFEVARNVGSIEPSPVEKRSTLYETGSDAHTGAAVLVSSAIRQQTLGNLKRIYAVQLRYSPSYAKTGKTLEDATRDHIVQTLEETKWVVGGKHGAAARLGIARTTLLSKMRRLGLELEEDRNFQVEHILSEAWYPDYLWDFDVTPQ